MGPSVKFYRLNYLTASAVLSLFLMASAAVSPSQLDLYDAYDNHLLYMTFQYNDAGLNTGREVFMSDGTFMRRVAISYNSSGKRASEVSYNFNEDTSWVMKYEGEGTGFSIADQFKLDQVGGSVNYTSADQMNFDLTYQKTGGLAARMAYEKDGTTGNLSKVSVFDQGGAMQYYGLFRYAGAGVTHPKSEGLKGSSQALVKPRGGSMIEVSFNLRSAGEVRCDLITLSGRHAATLLRGKMDAGIQKRSFRMDGKSYRGVAGGVYVFVVSIDGVTVSRSRYLHQTQGLGGVR